MNSLVEQTIEAHGGIERWRCFEHATAHLRTGGVLWALKHQDRVLDDVRVRVALRRKWASHSPFIEPNWRTSFEPHRVAIETADGRVVEECLQPRASFHGHTVETPWDRLHLAYFAGYAMWTYLNVPFLFATDDVTTEEVESWRENGETWRRLTVTFPDSVATHSATQTFYVGDDGLLRRHDYNVDVSGGAPAAHYVQSYQDFSGIKVPTRRIVRPRQPDGTSVSEPKIVTIDISEVEFT